VTNPFDGEALIDIGRFIQAQREIAQVSVRTLARAADVSDSYVSQLEKGKNVASALPSAQVLTDLAKGLNLAPEALIRMATWLPNAITGDDKDAVINAIAKDKRLKESQRQALTQLYKSMVEEG